MKAETFKKGFRLLQTTALVLLLGLSACRPQVAPQFSSDDRLGYVIHSIKASGETLFSISAWYTGAGQNWKQIADANPGINPNRLQIGDSVRIPRRLAIKTDPMPNGSMRSSGKSDSGRRATEERGTKTNAGDTTSMPQDDFADKNSDQDSGNTQKANDNPVVDDSSVAPVATKTVEESVLGRESESAISAESSANSVSPAAIDPTAVPTVEKRTKSRDELLQELLKDY